MIRTADNRSKDLRPPEGDYPEVLPVDVNSYYSIRSSCESSDRSLLHESSGFNQHVKTGNSIGVGPRKVPTTVTLHQSGFSTNEFFVFYHASDEAPPNPINMHQLWVIAKIAGSSMVDPGQNTPGQVVTGHCSQFCGLSVAPLTGLQSPVPV